MKSLVQFAGGVVAGEGAVLTSAAVNGAVLRRWGLYWAAGVSAPVIEELTKSGYAEALRSNVLISHTAFGASEGILYAESSGQVNRFDHRRPLLHASFGALYLFGAKVGGHRGAGLLLATLAHLAWNQLALHNQGITPGKADQFKQVAEFIGYEASWRDVKQNLLI